MGCYHEVMRHPLLAIFWWPWAQLNHWLMCELRMNLAVYIVAVVMTVAGVYSWLFFYRALHHLAGLRRGDATLLTALLFSFGYIMLALMVPDHCGLSLCLLLLTLWVMGSRLQEGRAMRWWQTGLLFLATAGITLSNGAKVGLSSLFTNGWRTFRWRYLLGSFVAPTLLLGGIALWQQEAFVRPMQERGQTILKQHQAKKDKEAVAAEKFTNRVGKMQGTKKDNRLAMGWVDFSVSRSRSLKDNVFGESLQLHRDHQLEDIYFSRPLFVS